MFEVMSRIVRITRPPSDNSMFSYVNTMMSLAHIAETRGMLSFVDWTSGNHPTVYSDPEASGIMANMWEWYFEQPHGVSRAPDDCETWVWVDGKFPGSFRYNFWSKDDLLHKQSIISRLLRPNYAVKELVTILETRYGILAGNTIAVSYRGNDAVRDSREVKPISCHIEVVDALKRQYPAYKIWIQTDDSVVLESFLKAFPEAIRIEEFEVISNPDLYVDKVSRKSGFQRGLYAVAMMAIMSRCAVLVKNISNLSDMASASSTGEIIHV
jgi:hypothetical protein